MAELKRVTDEQRQEAAERRREAAERHREAAEDERLLSEEHRRGAEELRQDAEELPFLALGQHHRILPQNPTSLTDPLSLQLRCLCTTTASNLRSLRRFCGAGLQTSGGRPRPPGPEKHSCGNSIGLREVPAR